MEWLIDAGLIYKVNRVKKGGIPLSAYEDFSAFKLFMLDTGLMGAMSGLPHRHYWKEIFYLPIIKEQLPNNMCYNN